MHALRIWESELSDLSVCSTDPASLNTRPAPLLAPVMSAVVTRSRTNRARNCICSMTANDRHASNNAAQLVAIVITVSLSLMGRLRRKRISVLPLRSSPDGPRQFLQLRADLQSRFVRRRRIDFKAHLVSFEHEIDDTPGACEPFRLTHGQHSR